MASIDLIRASNGEGDAVQATVTSARVIGSTTLKVSDVTNFPEGQFIGTTGTIDNTGVFDPATLTVFTAHLSGADVEIDAIAPGYADLGNTNGQVLVIKPNTLWADNVADTLAVSHDVDGTLKGAAIVEVLKAAYPVGSIYINATNSTNPGTLLGFGTWVAWGSGRVPVGVDTGQTEFDTVEKTGGDKTVTLSVAQMPSHKHTFASRMMAWDAGQSGAIAGTGVGAQYYPYGSTASMNNAGGDQPHPNLQPYITCYMWKRTA